MVYTEPGLFSFLCNVDNFGKILFACGQHEIQYINWEMNKYIYNLMCIFLYIIYYKNMLITAWKIDQHNAIHILGGGVVIFLFFQIFTKCISNIMYSSINKQILSFQNSFGVLSQLCQERVKDGFSFQMSPLATEHYDAGNILPRNCGLNGTALSP
jgi:hypothetical protein